MQQFQNSRIGGYSWVATNVTTIITTSTILIYDHFNRY